ncbi:MAG: hypothetical protein FJW38_23300 [Acidobacteria bacterium]|nr:hypothetical protein [Acidobacteriota bacterium]
MKRVLIAAAFSLAAFAQDKKQPVKPQPAPPVSGARVFKDPVTGEIRQPTAAERRQMDAQSSLVTGSGRSTRIIRNRDGSVTAVLGSEHFVYSVVRKNADGTLDQQCVTGEKNALSYVNRTKTPANLANVVIVKGSGDDKK